MAPTQAAQVQQRFHQSDFFTKNEAYKDFLIFLLGSLAFYQNYSQMPYLEGFLFQVQKLCRLECVLRVLGHFHINARSDALTAGTAETQRNFWGCRKAVAVTSIMAWAPPYSPSPLSFLSSSGFSRITPQLYERCLSPRPQHYKRIRKANPPSAHLRETPALLLSLCGCCQPFHTSHWHFFLLGVCSLPRDH